MNPGASLRAQLGSAGGWTYALSVAIRQRQIPSLVRKFLCLNPPSILSHTYYRRQKKVRQGKRKQTKRDCFSQQTRTTTPLELIHKLYISPGRTGQVGNHL